MFRLKGLLPATAWFHPQKSRMSANHGGRDHVLHDRSSKKLSRDMDKRMNSLIPHPVCIFGAYRWTTAEELDCVLGLLDSCVLPRKTI